MNTYTTKFGSLKQYDKGSIQIIQGKAMNYAFSNVFEVAEKAQPYDKTIVGLNQKYVIETVRAEGQSPWYTASHDEFVIVMDGEIRIEFLNLKNQLDAEIQGTQLAGEQPDGVPMGYVVLKKGHQAILPAGTAYRFDAATTSVLLVQTIQGPLSLEKWSDICLK